MSRNFWVASPSTLSPLANLLHPHPWIKRILFRLLPIDAFPKPRTCAYLLKISAVDGSLLRSIVDCSHPVIQSATDVYEKNGKLYISSVKGNFVAVIPSDQAK